MEQPCQTFNSFQVFGEIETLSTIHTPNSFVFDFFYQDSLNDSFESVQSFGVLPTLEIAKGRKRDFYKLIKALKLSNAFEIEAEKKLVGALSRFIEGIDYEYYHNNTRRSYMTRHDLAELCERAASFPIEDVRNIPFRDHSEVRQRVVLYGITASDLSRLMLALFQLKFFELDGIPASYDDLLAIAGYIFEEWDESKGGPNTFGVNENSFFEHLRKSLLIYGGYTVSRM